MALSREQAKAVAMAAARKRQAEASGAGSTPTKVGQGGMQSLPRASLDAVIGAADLGQSTLRGMVNRPALVARGLLGAADPNDTYQSAKESGRAEIENGDTIVRSERLRTPQGVTLASRLNRAMRYTGIPQATNAVGDFIEKAGGPVVGPIARDVAGSAAELATLGIGRFFGGSAAKAKVPAPVESARAAGYTLQPSQVLEGKPIGSLAERAAERGGGKASIPAEASLRNQVVTNRLVAKDLGLPEGEEITPASIATLRAEAKKAYTTLEKSGAPLNLAGDPAYLGDLERVRQSSVSELRGGAPDPHVDALVKELEKPKGRVNVKSVMDEVQQLRADAKTNFRSDNPATVRLARAQRKVSAALEAALDRGVGRLFPERLEDFRAARTQLAKLHNVEDALKGSDIDARVLAKARDNGEPLTGNLALVADMADYFPQVVQTDARLGSKAGAGLLDVGAGIATLGLWPLGRELSKRLALSGKLNSARSSTLPRPGMAPAVAASALPTISSKEYQRLLAERLKQE